MTLRRLDGVLAPAKLNLFLHIVGRRDDGYHLLQSAFVLIDWCDVLHFERTANGTLRRHDLGPALPSDDLCLRAARMLQQASGTGDGADIWVDKRIPTGAGMGGGSSDAATTLLALNRLWGLGWPLERLLPLGLALGADVPFFLGGSDAWVEGVGERCTPITLPPAAYAVVKPAASLGTAAIFAHPRLTRDTPAVILEGFDAHGSVAVGEIASGFTSRLASGHGRNDLQAIAELLCTDVRHAVAWLQQQVTAADTVRMTGSGSAVYARFDSEAQQAAVANAIAAGLPAGWVGRVCAGLGRHPLAGWAGGPPSPAR